MLCLVPPKKTLDKRDVENSFKVTVLRLALCKYLKIDSLVFMRKCQICNLTEVYCQGELQWNELLIRRYVGREVSFVSLLYFFLNVLKNIVFFLGCTKTYK